MINKIYKGKDNPVVINFTFGGEFASSGLNTFDNITLDLGDESYSTSLTPDQLFVENQTKLVLSIGGTTSLVAGDYLPTIIGYSATYDNGYLLTGELNKKINSIKILEQE